MPFFRDTQTDRLNSQIGQRSLGRLGLLEENQDNNVPVPTPEAVPTNLLPEANIPTGTLADRSFAEVTQMQEGIKQQQEGFSTVQKFLANPLAQQLLARLGMAFDPRQNSAAGILGQFAIDTSNQNIQSANYEALRRGDEPPYPQFVTPELRRSILQEQAQGTANERANLALIKEQETLAFDIRRAEIGTLSEAAQLDFFTDTYEARVNQELFASKYAENRIPLAVAELNLRHLSTAGQSLRGSGVDPQLLTTLGLARNFAQTTLNSSTETLNSFQTFSAYNSALSNANFKANNSAVEDSFGGRTVVNIAAFADQTVREERIRAQAAGEDFNAEEARDNIIGDAVDRIFTNTNSLNEDRQEHKDEVIDFIIDQIEGGSLAAGVSAIRQIDQANESLFYHSALINNVISGSTVDPSTREEFNRRNAVYLESLRDIKR